MIRIVYQHEYAVRQRKVWLVLLLFWKCQIERGRVLKNDEPEANKDEHHRQQTPALTSRVSPTPRTGREVGTVGPVQHAARALSRAAMPLLVARISHAALLHRTVRAHLGACSAQHAVPCRAHDLLYDHDVHDEKQAARQTNEQVQMELGKLFESEAKVLLVLQLVNRALEVGRDGARVAPGQIETSQLVLADVDDLVVAQKVNVEQADDDDYGGDDDEHAPERLSLAREAA